jgi:hypothetical protein
MIAQRTSRGIIAVVAFRAVQGAVPTSIDAGLDPAWLGEALGDLDDSASIVGIEMVDSSQTLAQKIRFRLTVEGAGGERGNRQNCSKTHLDGSFGADLQSEGWARQ